ncbi:MAG: dTDP-4-dehydrorhamnose reductase [Sneathiellales bacterium]|nr:dTDP-4-dehydrorhamnose reductase [Sneathiellales bacterium]
MKLLITGAAGQVGEALQTAAEERGLSFSAMTRQQLDISSRADVERVVTETGATLIINAAAYTAVDLAEEDADAAYTVNRDGPKTLADVAAKENIPLLHISTDFVFDGEKTGAYLETDPCNPLSVYGKSKWEGEKAITDVLSRHVILRTAWVFGGEKNFVSTMRRLAKERSQVSVVNDQRGGPTSAQSIAEALLTIAFHVDDPEFCNWGIYHFAGSPSVSWYEFASAILEGDPTTEVLPIPTTDYPTPATRPQNSVLNCSKIKSVFGIDQPDWRQEL